MDHQKRSELICWTTEEFIKGRSSARIKSELIENDVPQHEYWGHYIGCEEKCL